VNKRVVGEGDKRRGRREATEENGKKRSRERERSRREEKAKGMCEQRTVPALERLGMRTRQMIFDQLAERGKREEEPEWARKAKGKAA
jgi:hypothetical protein